MKFLIITVEKVSDAFTIFTSFNAKGLPLTLIDLLKSFYLEKSVDKIGEKLSLDKWNRLLSYFLNSNGEANSTLVTQFLQNNFDTYQTEKTSSITKSKALDEYQKLFKNEGEQYIDHLLDQAMIFSSFTNNIGGYNNSLDYSDEMNNLLDKISKLEATSIYPVIMYALNEYRINKINQNDIEDILYFLVNYFVRRNITLKPKESNLRARGLAVVREMQSKEKNGSYLEIIKRNLIPLAADDELFMIALKGSVYNVNRDTTQLILIDIERNYGSFFDKNQIIDNLNDKNDNNKYYWTLEHIMPQKVKDNSDWEKMLESTRGDNDKDLHHEEYVHKLGNLTLTGYNSELRNSEFIKKKNYVNKKKWSVKDIDRRNNILSEHVLKLHPLD